MSASGRVSGLRRRGDEGATPDRVAARTETGGRLVTRRTQLRATSNAATKSVKAV
jgi:hypothetical protein